MMVNGKKHSQHTFPICFPKFISGQVFSKAAEVTLAKATGGTAAMNMTATVSQPMSVFFIVITFAIPSASQLGDKRL